MVFNKVSQMRRLLQLAAVLIAVVAVVALYSWRPLEAPLVQTAGIRPPSTPIAKPSPFALPVYEKPAPLRPLAEFKRPEPPRAKAESASTGFKHRLAMLWPFRKRSR